MTRWSLAVGTATLLFCAMASLGSETNLVYTTNWVTASREFREVDGQLYNVDKSVKFESLHVECLNVSSNGMLFQTYYTKVRYKLPSDPSVRTGNFLGHSKNPPPPAEIRTEIPDSIILVTNGPASHVGEKSRFRAMPIGRRQVDGQAFDTFDYGLPHIVPVITTNRQILAKP
jgi:hypothetical protein